MYCSNCGTELREGTAFCPNCGQPVNNAQQNGARQDKEPEGTVFPDGNEAQGGNRQSGDPGPQPYQYGDPNQYNSGNTYNGDPYQYQQQPVRQEPDGFAIASLVLGIVSFFLLPIIGGILAIVFGNKSIRENGMNTMARVGKILGIVALVLYIIVIVLVIAIIAVVGVGAMSGLYYY